VEYEFPAERRRNAKAAAATKAATAAAAAAADSKSAGLASDAGVPASFITFQDKWGASYSCHWVPIKPEEHKLAVALEAVGKVRAARPGPVRRRSS
jgi:hypothetical protein